VHVGNHDGAAAFLDALLRRGKADAGTCGGGDENGFAGQKAWPGT